MKINKIAIPPQILEELIAYAKEHGRNEEVAGALIGEIEGDKVIVKELWIGENVLHSRSRFEINPEQLYNLLIETEKKGLEIVAFWHTHFGNSTPSYIDVTYMELWPIVWIVIDSWTGLFSASIYHGDKIYNVKVELLE
ncbi:MAG: Mov34/MPN/PAD-1 family protein [Candidatus Njordarchaeia archaeon]